MDIMEPRVSIIIPVYNGGDYLREAIDSAVNQTYGNIEVIVVNDGSTDNGVTEEIALSYGDRIRYFHKKNGGVATALNFGIKEMTGDYFSWLSHDDVYLPHKIAAQMDFVNRFQVPDAVIYANYANIDEAGNRIQDVHMPEVSLENMFEYLYNNQVMHGCTLLIPRRIFEEEGLFDEHLKTTQDYEYWLRICRRHPFLMMDDIVLLARQHANQGSRSIASHRSDVRSFYARHLPQLIEAKACNACRSDKTEMLTDVFMQRFQQNNIPAAWDSFVYAWSILNTMGEKVIYSKRLSRGLVNFYFTKLPGRVQAKLKSIFRPEKDVTKSNDGRLDFTHIYQNNGFNGADSISGAGSTMFQTRIIRREIPLLLRKLDVQSILDVPCGDFNWMQHVELGGVNYIGGDIVPDLVLQNQERYGRDDRQFRQINLMTDDLPAVDLVFCRDCLVHLPLADVEAALLNLKRSGAKWLLTTTFTDRTSNKDLIEVVWRPLNLQVAPFNLPEPIAIINECCTEGRGNYGDKCLALWRISDIP